MYSFLHQYASFGMWFLPAIAGVIFIVHGVPKVRHPEGIAATLHAPKFVGTLQGLVEVAGGLLLIFNFYVQIVSLVFALIMLGAIYFKIFVWKTPFFAHDKTGWELDLLLLAVFVLLLAR